MARSRPARVGSEAVASRAMVESSTLVIAKVAWPARLALHSAASVSAVSPDWEMTITAASVRDFSERSQYSLAYSTSTAMPLRPSISSSANRPAWRLEPLAAITSLLWMLASQARAEAQVAAWNPSPCTYWSTVTDRVPGCS